MGFIIPLIYILGNVILVKRFFIKSFELILPLSLVLSTLLVYMIGLLTNISIGINFILIMGVGAIGLELYDSIRSKSINMAFFSPSFVVFVFLYTIVYFMNLNRLFSAWDEFSHWGPMVKEMLRLDTYYTVPESTLFLHKNYPPIISLFETIWCYILGGYREGYLYRSLQLLSFSFFFPFLKFLELKWNYKSLLKTVLFVGSIFMLMLIIPMEDAHFYTNIYIDSILAIVFAYGMFLTFKFDDTLFEWIELISVLSFLILIKQMGMVFVFIIVGTFILRRFIEGKLEINKRILLLCLLIFVPLLFKYSWDIYIGQFDIYIQFSTNDINLSSFLSIASGVAGESFQIEAFRNFITALNDRTLFNLGLSLNYWFMLVFFAGLFGYLICLTMKHKKRIILFGVLFLLASLGYAFVMLLLYVYNFGFYEGPRLASYVRYINTFWFAGLVLWFALFISIQNELSDEKRQFKAIFFILLILSGYVTYQGKWSEINFALKANSSVERYYDDIKIIEEFTDGLGSVFVVAQRSTGHITNVMRYYIMPQWVNTSYYSLGDPYDKGDVWTTSIDISTLSNLLLDYKYVYLYEVDRNFRNYYYGLFENGSHPDNMQLFEVVPQENGLVFLQRIY